MMKKSMYVCDPLNFVPMIRTPWGGSEISNLKRKFLPDLKDKIPNKKVFEHE
jgi:hypothetical protein